MEVASPAVAAGASLRIGAAIGLLTAAAAVFAVSPLHGPILLAISRRHGLDLADLLILPVGVAAARAVAPTLRPSRTRHSLLTDTTVALAAFGLVTASTGALDLTRANRELGTAYDVVASLAFVCSAGWVVAASVVDTILWPCTVRTFAGSAAAVLLVGLLLDAAATPSGTLVGPMALSGHLALRSRHRDGRALFAILATVMVALNMGSLIDIAGIDVVLARSGGGGARGMALGAALLTSTTLELRSLATRERS